MAKKISNAKRLHLRHMAAMYRILDITGMTEREYCEFKYNCGLHYIALVLAPVCNDAVVTADAVMNSFDFKQMEQSAVFWGWWKLHWCERDWQFIGGAWQMEAIEGKQEAYSKRMRQDVYGELHNPYVLSKELIPNGAVLEASYARDLVPALVENRK